MFDLRVWILYATKQGSVERCARYMEQQREGVIPWDLHDGVPPFIRPEDKIILASGVYNGKVSTMVQRFVTGHQGSLKDKSVSLLLCCEQPELIDKVVKDSFGSYADQIDHVVYGGYAHVPRKLNPIDRLVSKYFNRIEGHADCLAYDNLQGLLSAKQGQKA